MADWQKLRGEFIKFTTKKYDKPYIPLTSYAKIRAIIWDKTDGRCWYCGKPIHPFREFAIDHVIPKTKNGAYTFDNLVPTCRRCNARKHNHTLDEFRAMQGGGAFFFETLQDTDNAY
jgi:5-methylcytosine-specific restriction endonuclease McrA